MAIRNMKFEDYENVKKLVYQVHSIHLNSRPDIYNDGDFLPLDYFKECLENKNAINLIYEEENVIKGILMADIQIPRVLPIIKQRKIYFIEDIVVDKNHRRKGIAKSLYNHLKKMAVNDNADSIELNLWSFNEEALSFYQFLGMSVKNMRLEDKLQSENIETNEIKIKTTVKTHK